jgi:hypothetical protein
MIVVHHTKEKAHGRTRREKKILSGAIIYIRKYLIINPKRVGPLQSLTLDQTDLTFNQSKKVRGWSVYGPES